MHYCKGIDKKIVFLHECGLLHRTSCCTPQEAVEPELGDRRGGGGGAGHRRGGRGGLRVVPTARQERGEQDEVCGPLLGPGGGRAADADQRQPRHGHHEARHRVGAETGEHHRVRGIWHRVQGMHRLTS